MHLAANQSKFEMVQWVLELMGVEELNKLNKQGRNPLHMACQGGAKESLEFLFGKGGNLSLPSLNGDTALHISVSEGHLELTRTTLSLGVDVNAKNKVN